MRTCSAKIHSGLETLQKLCAASLCSRPRTLCICVCCAVQRDEVDELQDVIDVNGQSKRGGKGGSSVEYRGVGSIFEVNSGLDSDAAM